MHNSSKTSSSTNCLFNEGPPSTRITFPCWPAKEKIALRRSTTLSPQMKTSLHASSCILLLLDDAREVTKIGWYSFDRNKGKSTSISNLLLITAINGKGLLPLDFLASMSSSVRTGGPYCSSKTVRYPTKIMSAVLLRALNSALSAGPPNEPEDPLIVASPLDDAIMFNITQGFPFL